MKIISTVSNYAESLQVLIVPGVCLVLSIFIIESLPNQGVVFPSLINSGHSLVFFFANLCLLKLCMFNTYSLKRVIYVSLCSLMIGLLIELVQPLFDRSRSVEDLVYDALGILASSTYYVASLKGMRLVKWSALASLMLALLVPLERLVLWHQINTSKQLLNFERTWESQIISVDPEVSLVDYQLDEIDMPGRSALVEIAPSQGYPGISIKYPKQDWTASETLKWRIYSINPTSFDLKLRIHDQKHRQQYHDRLNYSFTVHQGLNEFELSIESIKAAPKNREMQMSEVSNVKLFAMKNTEVLRFYLIDVWLE